MGFLKGFFYTFLTAFLLSSFAGVLAAQEAPERIVADMSQKQVAITTSFAGSKILLFGAVQRLSEADAPLDVIVTVSGPEVPVTVRKKQMRFGIWINTQAVEVDSAPTFYAIASTGPISEILSDTEDNRHKISIQRAIRSVDGAQGGADTPSFREALIRIREKEQAYVSAPNGVQLDSDTLFSTEIELPANLVEGDYEVEIYLVRDRQITAEYRDTLEVSKVGLERFIYNLAHERPLVYGLLSLFIAISAGWGASAVFRFIRF